MTRPIPKPLRGHELVRRIARRCRERGTPEDLMRRAIERACRYDLVHGLDPDDWIDWAAECRHQESTATNWGGGRLPPDPEDLARIRAAHVPQHEETP